MIKVHNTKFANMTIFKLDAILYIIQNKLIIIIYNSFKN